MKSGPQKRKPEVQLTKDHVLEDARNGNTSVGPSEGEELKMADPEVLKRRTKMKIIRSNQPAAQVDFSEEKKQQSSENCRDECDSSVTMKQNAQHCDLGDASFGGCLSAEKAETAADSKCEIKCIASTGGPQSHSQDAERKVGEPDSSCSEKPGPSKFTLFPGEIKGSASFISPFSSLAQPTSGNSFFLNPSSSSLFPSSRPGASGASGTEGSAEGDDTDVPPPEELTVVATAVDEGESVVFSDRDCRMQLFDAESKAWGPRPPLDGKVELVVPKEGQEASYTARILFFVNRTGRLRLNTPVLPSSMPFKHPVDRTSAAAVANTDDKTSAKSEDKKQGKEPPVKLNTVDFIGLKLDAADSKDTTLYRIRFSDSKKAQEFVSLANEKQEDAKKRC